MGAASPLWILLYMMIWYSSISQSRITWTGFSGIRDWYHDFKKKIHSQGFLSPCRSQARCSQSSLPHRASTRSQGNTSLPRLLFTMLCTWHNHWENSCWFPACTGFTLKTSLKWSAHSLQGYIRDNIAISSFTSFFCCLVGFSGYWAARVWRKVQVALPSSSLVTGPAALSFSTGCPAGRSKRVLAGLRFDCFDSEIPGEDEDKENNGKG